MVCHEPPAVPAIAPPPPPPPPMQRVSPAASPAPRISVTASPPPPPRPRSCDPSVPHSAHHGACAVQAGTALPCPVCPVDHRASVPPQQPPPASAAALRVAGGVTTDPEEIRLRRRQWEQTRLELMAAWHQEGTTSSKYDFVKVRVLLPTTDHDPSHVHARSYILSRFLTARYLCATGIAHRHAVPIALALKQRLVDAHRLTVTQSDLDAELFVLLARWGYATPAVRAWYAYLSRAWFRRRRPLVLAVGGTAGGHVGAALATMLADRMNVAAVVRTAVTRELLGAGDEADVARALAGDLAKCWADGKSVVLEGPDATSPTVLAAARAGKPGDGLVVAFLVVVDDLRVHADLVNDTLAADPDAVRRARDTQDRLLATAKRDGIPVVRFHAGTELAAIVDTMHAGVLHAMAAHAAEVESDTDSDEEDVAAGPAMVLAPHLAGFRPASSPGPSSSSAATSWSARAGGAMGRPDAFAR
ncbi:hypothetical protein H9P43_006434 [Blastocladiella emersonii ATCC 22665]|nr:hypothetical protein H9P43_006434 [Blastocladiella emersonii ATCC 22665]